MNWIIGGFVVGALAIGGFFVVTSSGSAEPEKTAENQVMQKEKEAMAAQDTMTAEAMNTDEGVMMNKDEGVMVEKKDEVMMTKVGSYEAYSSEKIANAATGKVVLFFRASWCPTCKVLDADIRAHLSDIPAGVTILDVNYDNSSALKQKYGVTYQHTLVQVDASGNQITKWSGGQTLASLLTNVR